MTVLVSFLVVLTEEMNFRHLFVNIASSLKLSEDIELNPGQYEIMRSVQESFSQSSKALFGETACRKCAFSSQ